MRIPPEKIDEIRNATDIVDLIGSFVRLKKRSKNYVGLCPFHTEKTPSFNVSPDRQMYHCFGCGVGGNVFTFVTEYEKVSFIEAVRSLAEKAGIALPSAENAGADSGEQEQLYEACKCAVQFFQSALATTEGKLALEYLRVRRGFSDETIKTFALGYAPNSWDAFLKHATEKGFQPAILAQAGLIRKREDGSPYDYFRGRVIFPIFSTAGRVVGFGARKLLEDDILGKYINSPETPIYNKSRILYGLYHSREAIRTLENGILVEGYADLIRLFQAGVKNVVASSGTALTDDQILLLGRYTKSVTVVYDADSAGSKAALRGVDLILARDLDVRVAELPEGDDPDSFVGKKGGEAFRKLVEGAVSFVDSIASAAGSEGKLATPEGQAQTVRSIVETISKMPDELKRNFYVKHVADKYGLQESTLYRELEKALAGTRRGTQREPVRPAPAREQTVLRQAPPSEVPPAERDLIHAMLDGGNEIVRRVFGQIQAGDFTHPHARAIATFLLDRVEEGEILEPSTIVNEIGNPDERRFVASVIFDKYPLSKRWTEAQAGQASPLRMADDALRTLKRRSLEQKLRVNQQALQEATRRGEDAMPFLEQARTLVDEIRALGSGRGEGNS